MEPFGNDRLTITRWFGFQRLACGDDTVGHVGNNVARNLRKCFGYARIDGSNEHSRISVS